jgi:hypothetical protein
MLNFIKKLKENKMEKEQFKRVDNLMQQLVGKENRRQSSQTISELFNLHNEMFPHNKQTAKSCAGCRNRVYRRLKDWWINNGGVIKHN